MRIEDFDYPLPERLVADRPPPRRNDARLMAIDRASEDILHRSVRDLPRLLRPGDLLILNDTRVIPARLKGRKKDGGAEIEILLLEQKGDLLWEAIAQRAIRLRKGTIVEFSKHNNCEVIEALGEGRFLFRFHIHSIWEEFLQRQGSVPLPPYILAKRKKLGAREKERLRKRDIGRYQTVYAVSSGSAAAPTAGLHFDQTLLNRLKKMGMRVAEVTLHVGLDTFSPVTVDRVEEHRMKSEWCHCPPETTKLILSTRREGKRVVAVGTTVCRTIESYARKNWPSGPIRTDLFLKPGDRFLTTDALMTNFHLPKSTLLMLVSAFMGNELRKRAYRAAVKEEYRFYSYGDAMLIL